MAREDLQLCEAVQLFGSLAPPKPYRFFFAVFCGLLRLFLFGSVCNLRIIPSASQARRAPRLFRHYRIEVFKESAVLFHGTDTDSDPFG
jgi:hypothetical protein